ncbi:WxL domain-containing protein [Enterococcus ureasiticus]|uniref:WxL domain-containing protein n=1 Tax=Enterococcus ureasiticus TaxID=903984 RepID=UPI001A8F9612|nr:WxL domain-containing protein [Enterococcus ureasiticus]MBO0473622.1 WxL domain-containing protein [Enterococcus ureasiticus]
MKKTIIFSSLFATGFILLGGTQASFAEETVNGSANGQGATSYGSIELTPDSDSGTDPLVPTTPSGKTGNVGELTIDNVSPFVFGTQRLTGKKATYYSTTTDGNVQVTDKRGTGVGWTLQVRSTDFIDSQNSSNILKGAQVTIPVGTVSSDDGNSSTAPTASEVALNATDATIFKAAAQSGLGSWVDKFDGTDNESKVSIEIPAGSMKGSYVSTITWTLADAPK